VENAPLCLPDIQAGILYSFNRQFCGHGCSIGIPNDFMAAQVHYQSQIGPSLFLYMDIGNISTPFLVDSFRFEITLQNVFLIIGNGSMIGMMVVFLYYDRAQPLLCHMSLNPFYAAGNPAVIEGVAYFNRPISSL